MNHFCNSLFIARRKHAFFNGQPRGRNHPPSYRLAVKKSAIPRCSFEGMREGVPEI